jgi:hypothetical protein
MLLLFQFYRFSTGSKRAGHSKLLRLLEKEASLPNSNVGGPFTVLHMKPDGTIEDVSDNEICNQSISSQAKSLTGAIR